MGDQAEDELFQWLLTQRLLHDVGLLQPERVEHLNRRTPGWDAPLTSDEVAVAMNRDNPDLNSAFERWWNLNHISDTPLTFAEIRVKAAMES